MAPAGNNNNPAVVLSEKVGVSLEQAAANLELLKKSLSASNTDQALQLEAERDELKAEKFELQAERAEFKAEKLEWEATAKAELEAAKAQLKAERLQLEAEKTQLKNAQSKLKDAQAQLQAANSQLETAHKQLDEARAELEIARSHLEAAKAQADVNSTKLEAAKASLEAAKARFQAAAKQLNAAKSRFEAAKIQLDSARATLEAEKSNLRDEKAALEKRVSEAESKNAKLEKDKLELSSELQQSKSQIGDLSGKLKDLAKQLEQCKKDKKTMQEVELPGLREKVKELEEQLKKCREDKKDTIENEKPNNIQDQKGNNPKVFLDIAINSQIAGRVVIELHADTTPLTAENFRALCTGEKGIGQCGKPLHYKGSVFYRAKPEEKLCQGGDITSDHGSGGDSIYGPTFPAENLTKKHAGPGVVSMVRVGNDPHISSGSQFFITTARTEEYDGRNVVFGQVVEGMEVVMEMMSAGSGASLIHECGQLNQKTNSIYLSIYLLHCKLNK